MLGKSVFVEECLLERPQASAANPPMTAAPKKAVSAVSTRPAAAMYLQATASQPRGQSER